MERQKSSGNLFQLLKLRLPPVRKIRRSKTKIEHIQKIYWQASVRCNANFQDEIKKANKYFERANNRSHKIILSENHFYYLFVRFRPGVKTEGHSCSHFGLKISCLFLFCMRINRRRAEKKEQQNHQLFQMDEIADMSSLVHICACTGTKNIANKNRVSIVDVMPIIGHGECVFRCSFGTGKGILS